jgi:hypothetical protein
VELSPFQRFAAFAVVVLVLAGLGAYLFLPQSSAAGGSPRPTQSGPTSPSRGASPASPGAPAPSGQAVPDIYQWLPFTPSDLASASATTISFAAHYGTYSYTQSAQAYLAPMRPEMTSQLADVIGRAFAAPGLAATRASTRQTSAATASILALRAFGASSLTFVVAIAQRITSSKGTSQQRADYAVTLTGTGSAWQVSDIELSSAGNN